MQIRNCENSHFFGGLIVAIVVSTTILGSSILASTIPHPK
jgi:hypothetical protein